MKLKELFEGQEKSLIGMKINGRADFAGKKWKGDFSCANAGLKSLKGAPSSISGDFRCYRNKLTSLEGAPSSVGGDFLCGNNKLTSLEDAPSSVGGDFDCYYNNLTSLEGIHKYIKEINGLMIFTNNPIKSHLLGLLKIKGLAYIEIDNDEISTIINKYLPLGNLLACQQELIDAGYEDYAQL